MRSADGYKETVIEGRTGYLVPVYRAPPDAEVTDAAFYLDYRRVLYHMVHSSARRAARVVARLAGEEAAQPAEVNGLLHLQRHLHRRPRLVDPPARWALALRYRRRGGRTAVTAGG